jgi:hypothetical protein
VKHYCKNCGSEIITKRMELPICPICLNATILLHQPTLVDIRRLEAEAQHPIEVPAWETPEQYEKRTREAWPEDAAVYTRAQYKDETWSSWQVCSYIEAEPTLYKIQIVCATEAGPPPDGGGWRRGSEK